MMILLTTLLAFVLPLGDDVIRKYRITGNFEASLCSNHAKVADTFRTGRRVFAVNAGRSISSKMKRLRRRRASNPHNDPPTHTTRHTNPNLRNLKPRRTAGLIVKCPTLPGYPKRRYVKTIRVILRIINQPNRRNPASGNGS